MTYRELIYQNRYQIEVSTMVVTDNATNEISYFIHTNFHVDYGISKTETYRHVYTNSKKKFNRAVDLFRSTLGGKLKFTGVNNDVNYIRMTYTLTHKHSNQYNE